MKILIIMEKQLQDTLKNKEVLIQFLMFPILSVIMNSVVKIEGMPENYFVNMFASMYIGMAPLVAMSSIIAEEKEKNTLRVLLMSDVKPLEYIAGVGGYIWLLCMAGGLIFCATGKYRGLAAFQFMCIMAVGIVVAMLIGAGIGIWSKSQMSATSVTVPVMLVFSFLPMMAAFNHTVEKIAKLTYSQQISLLIQKTGNLHVTFENAAVILLNMAAALAVFCLAYRKKSLL